MKDLIKKEAFYKALVNRNRANMLRFLRNHGDMSVSTLASKVGLSGTSTRKHLDTLIAVGLVVKRPQKYGAQYGIPVRLSEFKAWTIEML